MVSYLFATSLTYIYIHLTYIYIYMLSSIVTEATTFEMELRGAQTSLHMNKIEQNEKCSNVKKMKKLKNEQL